MLNKFSKEKSPNKLFKKDKSPKKKIQRKNLLTNFSKG